MPSICTTRREVLAGAVGLAALGSRSAMAATAPALPSSPVTLNIIDVAGNLQLTQGAIEEYARANPKLISRVTFSQAPAPELPGKLKAQQAAGQVDIDIVMTGTDALSAGIDQGLWIPVMKDYAAVLPNLQEILLPGAWKMQGLAEDQAMAVAFCPAGPIIEYMPDAVKTPPKTAQELLDYTRQHPRRFFYARPANSGPGRTFMQGIPYILGDKNPKDPEKGWDKTWEYLVELGKNIEYYPTGTSATMKELGEGSRDVIASHLGWYVNTRVLGIVPKEAQLGTLAGFHWVTDQHYWAIPKGIPAGRLAVVLELFKHILTKPAQAMIYDKGYHFPGPEVKGVTLDMAPPDSQKAVAEFAPPGIDKLIAEVPMETPLDAQKLVYAFQRWDQQVGARVGK